MPGPIALVGSGEYLPVMAPVEAALLAGRPARYVQLPTAAAEEGPGSVARWVALGAEQAQRLGVEAVPVMVLDRATADDETGFKGKGDLVYRAEGWNFLLAGGAIYDNLDYSFTPHHPDGSAEVTTSARAST